MKRSGAGGDDSMSKRQRGEPSTNLANALSGLGLPSTSTLKEVERLYDEERSRESTLQRSITEGQREMSGTLTANQEVELSSRLEQYREELGALQTRRLLFDAAKKELEKSSGGGRKAAPAAKKRGAGKAGGGRKAVVGDDEEGEEEEEEEEEEEPSSSDGSGESSSSSSSSEESSEGEEVAHDEDAGPFGRRRRKPAARRRAAPAAAARREASGSDSEGEGSDSGGGMRGGRRLRKSTAQRRKAAAGSGSEGEEEGLGEFSKDVKYAGANKKNQAKAKARERRLYGSDSEYSEDGGRGGKGGKGGGGGKRGGANFRDDYYEDEEGDEFDDEDGGAEAVASLDILNGILGGDDGGGGGGGGGGAGAGGGAPGGSGSGSGSGAAANLALKALLYSSTPDTSPATLQDINSIRMSRQQALSYLGAPYFKQLAAGCYVKLAKLPPFPPEADILAGRATKYRVCRIHAVGSGLKTYDPFKTDGGYDKAMLTRAHMDRTQIPRRTDLALHLALGSSLTVPTECVESTTGKKRIEDRPRLCEIHALSDRQITELEWAEYLQRCSRNAAERKREGGEERERGDKDKASKSAAVNKDDAPTKADIRRKRKAAAALIQKAQYREEDVERTLLRKEAQMIDQIRTMPNVMYLKAKYETEKAVAEEELAALPKDATEKVRAALVKKVTSFGRIIESVEKETERRKLASQAAQREKAADLGPSGGSGMGLGGDHSAAAAATAAAAAAARGGGGGGKSGGGKSAAAAPGLSSLSTAVNAKFRERNAQRLRAAADDDRAPEPMSKDDEDELLGYVRQRSRPQSLFNVNAGEGYKKPSEEAEKKAEAPTSHTFDISRLMEDAVPEVNPVSGEGGYLPSSSSSSSSSAGAAAGGPKGGAASKRGGKQQQQRGEGGEEEEQEEEEEEAVEEDLFSDAPPKAPPASEPPKKAGGMSFAEFKARKAGAKA